MCYYFCFHQTPRGGVGLVRFIFFFFIFVLIMLKLSRIYKEHCNALTSSINHVDSVYIPTSRYQLVITIVSA